MWVKIIGCVIGALVSSQGSVINVDNLRRLESRLDGGCNIYQTFNPPVIHSTWTCQEVEDSIIGAIIAGCEEFI